MRLSRPTTASVAVALAIGALAAPATASQDLRSPDAADPPTAIQDLRSPDAADVAKAQERAYSSYSTPTATPRGAATPTASGFDWGDAAIGAGGAMALVAVALGGAITLRHRRSRPSVA